MDRWIVGCLVLFLPMVVDSLACTCGVLPRVQVESGSTTSPVCFQTNIQIDPFCTRTRVRIDNVDALPVICANTRVGSRGVICNGWKLAPDPDGISYQVFLCQLRSATQQIVSFASCSPETTEIPGFVFAFENIQAEQPDPMWSSVSQCRNALCPEAAISGLATNAFITTIGNQNFSICNREQDSQNFCDSTSGTCSCHRFLDGTRSFTGNSCQFEKGRGLCCAATDHSPRLCCQPSALVGQCLTLANVLMCGVAGQSRSSRCISPDGISQPSCTTLQIVNSTTNATALVPNCPTGLTCPGSPLLNINSPCTTGLRGLNCSCQCSLCGENPTTDCSGGQSIPRGLCTLNPGPVCQCFVPAAPCISPADNPNACDDVLNPVCQSDDLCGGVQCGIKLNGCRTQTQCDTSQPWQIDKTHPCICNGNGLCNTTLKECRCFDVDNGLSGFPVFSTQTQCAGLDSCIHCNNNPNIPFSVSPAIAPSTCHQFTEFPAAFNCSCSRYWYTSGSFQDFNRRVTTTPVFQCSTGTCIGDFELVPFTLVPSMYVDPTTRRCVCPPGTTNYFDPNSLREYCRMLGQGVSCNTTGCAPTPLECGHGDINFIEKKFLPVITIPDNISPITAPQSTLASMGGFAACTCEGFFNETQPQGSWYTVKTAFANATCAPWCTPPVTFFLQITNDISLRTCVNCATFGLSTVTLIGGETQCGPTVCLHNSTFNDATQRCDCIVYPYDFNFPGDISCSLSRCSPFPFDPVTNNCTCPGAYVPSGPPPIFIGPPEPLNQPGCISACGPPAAPGFPDPNTGFATCSCPPAYSGTLCQTVNCQNGGSISMVNASICSCLPAWSLPNCITPACTVGFPPHSSQPPISNSQCACTLITPVALTSFFATNATCGGDFCVYFKTGETSSSPRSNVKMFQVTASNGENITSTPPGYAFFFGQVPPLPTPEYKCVCAGFGITATPVLPVFGGAVILNTCGQRSCFDNQDIVLAYPPPVINGATPPFQCRCSCPFNLTTTVFPIGSNLTNCPAGLPVNVIQSSLNNPCPGYLPFANHSGWEPQCLTGWIGINCSVPTCPPPKSAFAAGGGCVCVGFWSVPPLCEVCTLTGDKTSPVNLDTCQCNRSVAVVNLQCTNNSVPCDFNLNPLCPVPSVTGQTDNPPLENITETNSVPFIVLVTILSILFIVIVGLGIGLGVQKMRADQKAKIAAEKLAASKNPPATQSLQSINTKPTPANTSERTPLVQPVAKTASRRHGRQNVYDPVNRSAF